MNETEKHIFEVKEIYLNEIDTLSIFLAKESEIGLNVLQWKNKILWIWKNNPFHNVNELIGWKIVSSDNRIYGFLGSIPVNKKINNESIKLFFATSWYVNINARAYSLKLFEKFSSQKGILFNNTPILKVEPILKKIFHFTKADNYWFKSSILYFINPYKNGLKSFKISKHFIVNNIYYIFIMLYIYLRNFLFSFISIFLPTKIIIKRRDNFLFYDFEECQIYSWLIKYCDNPSNIFLYEIYSDNKLVGTFLLKNRLTNRFTYLEFIESKIVTKNSLIKTFYYYFTFVKFLNKNHSDTSFIILKSHLNLKFLAYIIGLKNKINQTTFYRNNTIYKDLNYLPTSIEGDSVFF